MQAERLPLFVSWCGVSAIFVAALVTPQARCADPGLKVTKGLELWLNAGSTNSTRAARGQPPLQSGQPVETWFDGSGQGRHVVQPTKSAQPQLIKVGDSWVVRFDGRDDHL